MEMKSETDTLLKSYGDLKLMDTDSVRLAVTGDWCLFIMREKYCWLAVSGVRENTAYWLQPNKVTLFSE